MKTRQKRRPMSEINVVPYIDVMLVLLIIFMVTTPLLSQGVKVDLPQAQAKQLADNAPEPIIVSVDARGDYFLNIARNPNVPISAEDLVAEVSNILTRDHMKHQKPDILVKGDQHVDYGKVVHAMVLLQQAGAPSVGLMTKNPA